MELQSGGRKNISAVRGMCDSLRQGISRASRFSGYTQYTFQTQAKDLVMTAFLAERA
jgi:hypothetical protein